MGCGGIVGVNAGSVEPPRVVKLVWAPAGATNKVVLVGKGVMYDSGGISLKPPADMEEMKMDKNGAIAVIEAAARDLAPHDLTFYVRDIAGAFHALYNERELRVLSAAEEVKMARLALYAATAQIIRNTLALLGVSAPEHM